MSASTRILGFISVLLLATACGRAHRAAPAVADDDNQGNASAGVSAAPTNNGVQAAFGARSYAPGDVATLRLRGSAPAVGVAIYHAGAGRDGVLEGALISAERTVAPTRSLKLTLGHWPSGLYYARVVTPGRGTWDAPFVLRPMRPGTARIAIVLPTNTWQAYNNEDGGSWYFDAAVTHIDLARPYVDAGVPPHYRGYDRGFLRWLAVHGVQADFLSDDDLDALSGERLARSYDQVIFSGHEEYVTAREFDVTQRYRDLGGNLAFLSANDFFYKVEKQGDTMVGRWRWRDLGRPESALVGAEYVDWNHDRYPNRPFEVAGAARAPWLFRGTGLTDGARFGVYGIEVDAVTPSSPHGTQVLARISDIFGAGKSAEMTYYATPRGAKVFSAGVMNFGGSALWPQVSTMIGNIIDYLREP
jgi:hypothetical protein